MPKATRESKMLERVRGWRTEAYELLRRKSEAMRRQRANEWARRLNLPIIDDDAGAASRAEAPAAKQLRHP
jgi:hypothetical protein